MSYEIVVAGRAEGALRAALSDLVGALAIRAEPGGLTLWIRDQSALVAVLNRLHDLSITIERVKHVRGGGDQPVPG